RQISRDLQYIIRPQQPELPKHMKDAVEFLGNNTYGFLYGDDEQGEYEFIWVSSPELLFENAADLVRSLHDGEFEDTTTGTSEWAVEESLILAKRTFEEFGLSDDALKLLVSTMHERSGISWWGLFHDLMKSEELWPKLVRNSFRN